MTSAFLRGLPKIQLHCHLEGTLRAATFLELAAHHGVSTTYSPGETDAFVERDAAARTPENVYAFADFQEFLLTFAAVSRSLSDPGDYGRLAAEYAADAIAQNVMYAELFISPSVWMFFHPELDVRDCVGAIRNAFSAANRSAGIELRLICDLTRNFGLDGALRTAALAADMQDLGVLGVGLGGDEARFPPELFENAFTYARARGLHAVVHAGEAAGAQSVRAAVEILQAERIGHGVRALEDASVVELLVKRRIPLEICPTSNFLTGAASRAAPHPLLALDAAGVVVTIDADDPALFSTTLTEELEYVAGLAGEEAVLRFMRNAANASFAESELKKSMLARLDHFGLELTPGRRT